MNDSTEQTIQIPLSKRGKNKNKYVTIISIEDMDLAELNWCIYRSGNQIYAQTRDPYRIMHRIVIERMLGRKIISSEIIEHINGNELDNRRCNLRIANDTTETSRECKRCGEIFPLDDDHFPRQYNNKFRTHCKDCEAEYKRQYALENEANLRERRKQYYDVNRERILARHQRYYQENRDRLIAYQQGYNQEYPDRVQQRRRQYYQEHKEQLREQGQQYRERNREEVKRKRRLYYLHNKERLDEYNSQWRAENREHLRNRIKQYNSRRRQQQEVQQKLKIVKARYKARKRNLPDTFTATDWQRALDYFHGCCAVCGRPLKDLFGTHTAGADHWIPLSSPDCPGTIPVNMLPLCHGQDGCNNSKGSKIPEQWLVEKFGRRKANEILKRIETYFRWIDTTK